MEEFQGLEWKNDFHRGNSAIVAMTFAGAAGVSLELIATKEPIVKVRPAAGVMTVKSGCYAEIARENSSHCRCSTSIICI
ncbi:Uncharacterized protein TCM_006215 [Theobroma cacao]|uniref:Uncharacterized protein n=1 Tax=Theobroma cacao TaxID=3641 RepID=A0A061DWC6_THECC|nr:Uncharacterized protein TCM_006215 [Theobroma cacao]